MYSLSGQAKRHNQEDSAEGFHPTHAPKRDSAQDIGATAMERTGSGVAAAIAASRARKPSSGRLQATKQLDDDEEEEEVGDYLVENQEYASPPMTNRNEKARYFTPGASGVGIFAVQGPGMMDEENQSYVSTLDENANQGSEDGSTKTGSMMLNPNQDQEPIEALLVSDNQEMQDQARVIAEMVQKELMANATVPVEVASGGPPSTQDAASLVIQEDAVEVGQRNKRLVLIAIALLVIIAAVGAGVGVALSKKPPDDLVVPTQPPPSPPQLDTPRVEAFQDFLAPISGDVLKDTNSPQYQALNWLANVDAANMTIGVDSETAIKTRYVAAVLYYAFQGDAWASKYNFLSDRGTCSWNQRFVDGNHGVACSSDDTVESFQLPANNLVGSIPREIGYYTNLIDLDLSDNMIGGSIASLVNLTHLGTLNCSLNSLTGTLPEFLFTHRSLTDIDLNQNRFFGSISDSLGNSDQLRVFWTQNNSLTGTIPSAVGQSWVLGSIDVHSNQLTGTIPDFTPSSRIWDLHLANNMLTGTIPTTIGSLSSLMNLGLYGNWLTGTVPTELGKCRNIIYVDFGENSLSGNIGQVVDSLPSTLESLDASGNLLEGTIPISVGTFTKVSFLDLQENKLGGTLPSEIGLLRELQFLSLAHNEFTGSVPSTLANLSNLVDLRLQGNNLNGSLDWLCSIDFDVFAANTCSEPDKIECACCTHCCNPGAFYCEYV